MDSLKRYLVQVLFFLTNASYWPNTDISVITAWNQKFVCLWWQPLPKLGSQYIFTTNGELKLNIMDAVLTSFSPQY